MSAAAEPSPDRRSQSRGRDFTSSGRGGAGNIRRQSASRDPERNPDLPEVPVGTTRGREPVPSYGARTNVSVGRGGAGNILSPSRDAKTEQEEAAYERELIRKRMEERQAHAVTLRLSSHSPFCSTLTHLPRSRDAYHSTGRGGAGNIYAGDGIGEVIDEEERRGHEASHDGGIHSTGRGGLANMTALPTPPPEHHEHHLQHDGEGVSTGRGGRGNIRSRSRSRDVEGRGESRDRHGIREAWNRVVHGDGEERERGRA
ncbi:hypothetical protein OE88DRAFT_1714503 [Heliocybe sulcata]|uniref:Uncharacterized protein n=1 Tax=Heliocybe sulcata TaxID=5364 RepID=A0A5C3MV62_9AGAM|nr:hypothetical protein OE88DRAFT_1714503 [Heliocybe sulcata]